MPANTEGTDPRSWVENRTAFRRQVRDTLNKLEDCGRRLTVAVGCKDDDEDLFFVDTTVSFADRSIGGITALTQESVSALGAAETEKSQLASARKAAKSALETARAEVQWAAEQRAKQDAEEAAQKQSAALKRQSQTKRIALRAAAIGILLAAVFVVYNF